MLSIALTRHPHARKELFFEKSLRVVSRSGLNPTERLLLEHLPDLRPEGGSFRSPLFLGGRTGALAMALWLTRGNALSGSLTLHTTDAHTEEILLRNLEENRAPAFSGVEGSTGFRVVTELEVERFATGNIVFWQMTRGDTSAEAHLACLERLASDACPPRLQIVIACEMVNDTFLDRFRKLCANAITLRRTPGATLLSGRIARPIPFADLPNHTADFEVSLKGHAPITLSTLPGCFCHRRADMGGLALTEVVAENVAFDVGDRVMDLGCGCGMDGILLATAFPEKRLKIDYQDSDASARESTLLNLKRHPHEARFIFSAKGEGESGAYSVVLANPPYFGDWRIAEFFIQTASRLLKPGGLLAFVAKRESKPLELATNAGFQLCHTFSRRGYTILLLSHP